MTLRKYLDKDYSLYKNGSVIFTDGREEKLRYYLHLGTMVDTILLGTDKGMSHGEFLLRWRIYPNSLKIYDIDKKVSKIIWINESDKHIRVDNYGLIAPGDMLTIQLNDN